MCGGLGGVKIFGKEKEIVNKGTQSNKPEEKDPRAHREGSDGIARKGSKKGEGGHTICTLLFNVSRVMAKVVCYWVGEFLGRRGK